MKIIKGWRLGLAIWAMSTTLSAQELARPLEQNRVVVFICEHGNVKSLMAASYFNQIAKERKLPYLAISRGVEPDANSAPPAIVQGLAQDHIDVRDFRPQKIADAELNAASRVITIGTTLVNPTPALTDKRRKWNEVPPASVDFKASSQVLKSRVNALIDELEKH